MLTRRQFGATAAASLFAGPAMAQDQTVRLVSGFPAGGGIDISARLLVDPFKDALGLPVIVENRVGAAGMIAANAVAKAAPDGRMMLVVDLGRDRDQPASLQGEDVLRSAEGSGADHADRHRAERGDRESRPRRCALRGS